MVQFNFTENDVSTGKYEDVKNLVLYTGTHDNDTINGWYKNSSRKVKANTRKFLKAAGLEEGALSWRMVEFTLAQDCFMAVIPLQDILDLGEKAKLNSPGTLGSPNWEWKLKDLSEFKNRTEALAKLIKKKIKTA